jgi:hypothetical protein
MPIVAFTRHLQRFFPSLDECEIPGETVRAIVNELERRYPGLASYLVDEAGHLRRHVNIFIGEEPIGDRRGLTDRVAPTDRVSILQALSGG